MCIALWNKPHNPEIGLWGHNYHKRGGWYFPPSLLKRLVLDQPTVDSREVSRGRRSSFDIVAYDTQSTLGPNSLAWEDTNT